MSKRCCVASSIVPIILCRTWNWCHSCTCLKHYKLLCSANMSPALSTYLCFTLLPVPVLRLFGGLNVSFSENCMVKNQSKKKKGKGES